MKVDKEKLTREFIGELLTLSQEYFTPLKLKDEEKLNIVMSAFSSVLAAFAVSAEIELVDVLEGLELHYSIWKRRMEKEGSAPMRKEFPDGF